MAYRLEQMVINAAMRGRMDWRGENGQEALLRGQNGSNGDSAARR